MKKFFTTVLAASLMLIATNASAQLYLGAGYLNSDLVQGNTTTNMNGGYVGGNFGINLMSQGSIDLAFVPGAYVTYLGSKDEQTVLGSTTTTTMNELFVDVPVSFKFNYNLTRDYGLFAYAGPVVRFGLSSTSKIDNEDINTHLSSKNFEDTDYARVQMLLGLGVGFELNKQFQFTIGYDLGLNNLYTGDDDDTKWSRNQLRLGVAYKIF